MEQVAARPGWMHVSGCVEEAVVIIIGEQRTRRSRGVKLTTFTESDIEFSVDGSSDRSNKQNCISFGTLM